MIKMQIIAHGHSAAPLLVRAGDEVIGEDINMDQVNYANGKL